MWIHSQGPSRSRPSFPGARSSRSPRRGSSATLAAARCRCRVDLDGPQRHAAARVGEPGAYANLSLSPNEQRSRRVHGDRIAAESNIWVIDLTRADTPSQLTFDPAGEGDPIWCANGSQISSIPTGGPLQQRVPAFADGGGQDLPVVKMERLIDSPDWSHDGRFLVFTGGGAQTSNDLWVLPCRGIESRRRFCNAVHRRQSGVLAG